MRLQFSLRHWFYATLIIGVILTIFTQGWLNQLVAEWIDWLFGYGWGPPRSEP